MVLSATIWHISRERNARVSKQQVSRKIIVFGNLYQDIRIFMTTCHWKVDQDANTCNVLANWNA